MSQIAWTYDGLEVIVPTRTSQRPGASAFLAIAAVLASVLVTSWAVVHWGVPALVIISLAAAAFWGVAAATAIDEPS